MASFNCKISPRTSTVIFFDRSPLATAIVTSAILRTCAVKFDAIEFTLSVRSFQTPVTSRTCAWPPNLPSVPTSRATRVTSEVNTLSCLIMVLTMLADRRNSPFNARPLADRRNSPFNARPSTSNGTVCSRSPRATAVTVRVTAVVGHNKSSMSVFTDASMSAHHFTDMLELLCNALIRVNDGVEGVADFSRDPYLRTGQANGEIPRLHCTEHIEQLIQIEFRAAIPCAGAVPIVVLFLAGDARVYVHDYVST